MTKAQQVLDLIPKNEASNKLDNMLSWINSLENMDNYGDMADKAHQIFAENTDMFDETEIKVADLGEMIDFGKKHSGAEYYVDGDVIYVCADTQALSSKLQALARQYKLDIPRF